MTKKQENKRKILIALLILSVVATGAYIGTIAKYVTSSTASDSAVVAKFGLNVPNTIQLFSDSYTNVKADVDGKKIVAPGTKGQYNFAVTGASEVAYRVSANITVLYSEEWDGYTPLEFSIDGTTWTTLEDFKVNLSNALASETISPGNVYSSTQKIYWRWPFHVSEEFDIKDTQMGIAAATETAPEVTVNINMIAAQVE